jgi:glycine cleavage system H protein
MAEIPDHLLYTEEHEWIEVEDDDVALIGITDFAQGELGDIVFVELPQEGEKVSQGETLGTIEAVKTVEDMFAPISGEVVAVNKALEDTPTLINSSPYQDGWIIKIRLSDRSETERLLSAADYRDQIGEGD